MHGVGFRIAATLDANFQTAKHFLESNVESTQMPFIPSEIFRGKNPPIQMKTDHSGPNNNNATESGYTRCTVPISNLCRYHKESQSMNLDVH